MGDEGAMDVCIDQSDVVKLVPVERDTLPWVEKYRPKNLNELIAHEEIIRILNRLIESNKLPHLLFYGPPGTGMLMCTVLLVVMLCIYTGTTILDTFINHVFMIYSRQDINDYGMCKENVW